MGINIILNGNSNEIKANIRRTPSRQRSDNATIHCMAFGSL
jgi:hypothetical protein